MADGEAPRPKARRQRRARPARDDWELSLDLVFSATPSREAIDQAMADAAALLGVSLHAVRQRAAERARRRAWQSPLVLSDHDIKRIQGAPDFDAAFRAVADGRADISYLAFERALRSAGRPLARLQWRENQKRAARRRA